MLKKGKRGGGAPEGGGSESGGGASGGKEEPPITQLFPTGGSPDSASSSGSSSESLAKMMGLEPLKGNSQILMSGDQEEEEAEEGSGEEEELARLYGPLEGEGSDQEEDQEGPWQVVEEAEYPESEGEDSGDDQQLAEIQASLDTKPMDQSTLRGTELSRQGSVPGSALQLANEEGQRSSSIPSVQEQNSSPSSDKSPTFSFKDAKTEKMKVQSRASEPPIFSYQALIVDNNCKSKKTTKGVSDKGKGGMVGESVAEVRMGRCPSIESIFQQRVPVQAHFYLYPGKKMISRECRVDVTVYQLKVAISRFLNIPTTQLDLRWKRSLVPDSKTLQELGAKGGRVIRFLVETNTRVPGRDTLRILGGDIFVPKKDTKRKVMIHVGKKVREVELTVQHPTKPKPNLGGFIDQRKGIGFNHASTGPEPFDDTEWQKSDLHQSCQTFNEEDFSTQTVSEKGVQMERDDYYVSSNKDYVLRPRPYKSFDYHQDKKKEAAIVIQRNWREWLSKKDRQKRLEGLVKRVEWAEIIRKGRLDQRLEIMVQELARQRNPTSLLDLELLYRAINSWREGEESYVKKNRWGAERKAALATLTEMEADLLLQLERTKIRILENGRDENMNRQFVKMSLPKRWLGSKTSSFISYDTGGRLKARGLHDIYKELNLHVPNEPEPIQRRIQLLQRLNALVSEKGSSGSSNKTEMISELISRELRFLNINASATLLAGVRRRIGSTFFCLCKDPNFNPEARRIEKIPYERSKLRKDMVQCKGCRRMQYRDEFTIVKGTTLTSRCHTCMGLYRTAILRIDLNLYRQLLKELRRDEYEAGVVNSVTFLMDAFDMRFLVEQIWHGQSALSGIDNRYLLRLCRWKKSEPWAPWNSVLLTEEEAVAHIQLQDLDTAYQKTFFHKVFVKQATAKSYFEGLSKVAVGVDDRIAENCQDATDKQEKSNQLKNMWQNKVKTIKVISVMDN